MASGQTLWVFKPLANETPISGTAGLAFIAATTGHRPVLTFDRVATEAGIWTFVMPSNYSALGITLDIFGAQDVANTDTKVVQMEAQFERTEAGVDLGGANDFAAIQEDGETTVNNTEDALFKSTITFTNSQIDGLLVGESGRLQISRNNTTGGTNAEGDFQLLLAHMKET